jgi:hypothetical protein
VAANGLVDEALASGLVQPDQTTCGSCALVVARMLDDADYASFVVNGPDPSRSGSAPGALQGRFRREVLAMHRLTSGFKDSGGDWQVPWPTALGTQPWALAREMTLEAGVKGKTYTAVPILPSQRASTFRTIVSLAGAGDNVPLYVGNQWSPRHVVLVLPWDEQPSDRVRIYDPASGRRYPIEASDFSAGRLDVAGWNLPWVVVVPS